MATRLDQLSDETRDQLAEVALKLANGKTRKSFLGLMKQATPELPIPEIDTENAIEERLSKEREERQKFEEDQRNRWLQEDLQKNKREVSSKYGLSDEDMTKMEKMMTEKALPPDYNWAAQLYKQQLDSAQPTNYGSSGFNTFNVKEGAKEFDGIMDDADTWARNTAHQMIDEMQKRGKAPNF